MASKQPTLNQPTDSANQLIGQFNHFQLNVNQLGANQSNANQLNANQTTTTKKKAKNVVKKDAIKNSQQFNYQNLNVNLNPKEKIVQDQSIKLKSADGSNSSNQLQFKIVQPDEDGQPSLKLKIATTRKPGGHSELRKLRISNQNLNKAPQSNFVSTNLTSSSTSTVQSDLTSKPIATTNQVNSNHLPLNPPNPIVQNLSVPNPNFNSNTNLLNHEHVVNQKTIDSINKHQIVNNPTDEHEPNCMCYLHSNKNKKLPDDKQKYLNKKKSRLSSSSSSNSSSSASSSRSSSCSKASRNCSSEHSKSSDGNSSRSSSSSSSTNSSSTHSNSSSNSSSSSSSSSSYSSNCSSRSSSSSSSRSGSCRSCASSRSSSASSSSSSSIESCSSSIKKDKQLILNRGRSKQKEPHHQKIINENLKNKDLDQSTKSNDTNLSTQQLLNNVNESLIKHQKQKLNLNQLNISSPFSPNDLPSPLNFNNHLNSQPSSVSCESNCYSPSVSINSPSCTSLRKQDPVERQKLRSYRLPHLTVQQQQQQLLLQQQHEQSKKANSNKESKALNESNKETKLTENLKSNASQDQIKESTPKKTKKQKGGKKKVKLNKKNTEGTEDKKDGQIKEPKELKQQKVKKKIKKLKQTGEGKSKKIKKKGKKKGKLTKKKAISNANLIENLDLIKSKILDPSTLNDLNSSNANSELSKMCLLMNANLNSGIPPNIDTNVILPSLSSLIKEDKNLLIKNQYLISQNLNNKLGSLNLPNLNSLPTSNQESSKTKSNLVNKNKESQSTNTATTAASKSDKSPDSGIQSQSESPNQLNSQLNESNAKVKKTKKANNKNETVDEVSTQKPTKSQTKSKSINNSNAIATASSNNQDNNLPKKNNNQLINQLSSKLPNLQKDPLFNQFMDNSIQSLISNLQKTPANFILNNLNSQSTSNSLINSNSSINSIPIKPKSIPSDLITLTEFLLNMTNKNKDANLNKAATNNLNTPTTSSSFPSNAVSSTAQTKETAKQKKQSKSNESELLKSIKLTNNQLNRKDDFSFKEITDQQHVVQKANNHSKQQSTIKNTDLWRNNDVAIANSPLNIEELNKRLRSTNEELINSIKKKIKNDKQTKSTGKKSTKRSAKQNKNEEQDLLNLSAKELNKQLVLNQNLKKNLLSDILCANDLDIDNNSNQQSRSVSSLSQNHYGKNGSKKKKRKHKTKKDGLINELDDEQDRVYSSLVDDLFRLEVSKSGASKSSKNAGVFKCIKYGKGKKNKQKPAIQFSSSTNKLQLEDKLDRPLDKLDKTKKRKKNSSYSQQLDQQEDSLIKLSEDSQNTDNANEHSLPLKKRHHRHTENKCEDDDLIDSSNSSSTELLKINLRTKSTKSNKKIRSISENMSNELSINTANQLESTNAKNNAAIITNTLEPTQVSGVNACKNIVSQINSCSLNAATWLTGKQQHSSNEHTIANVGSGENKQATSPFNKNRSTNVDINKESGKKVKLNSSLDDLELDESIDDSNMVVTRKSQPNGRKLRSNSTSTKAVKMGSMKSKLVNNELSVINGDDLKNEKLTKVDKVDKTEFSRLRNKSNENSNLVQTNDKIKKSNESSKIRNQNKTTNGNHLKPKSTLTITKKRRKQNKTGFDKPKKRKKIAPKIIEQSILNDEFCDFKTNEIKLNDYVDDKCDKSAIEQTQLTAEMIETGIIDLINCNGRKKSNQENRKRTRKDDLVSLDNSTSKSKKSVSMSKKIVIDQIKDNLNEIKEIEEPKETKESAKLTNSKLVNKKNVKAGKGALKRKSPIDNDDTNDKSTKQIKVEQKKEPIKSISNKTAINKASKKLIKKSTKLINKSKNQIKTSSQIKKLTKPIKPRSKSISEEPKDSPLPSTSPSNPDDDFEEVVLKIHSVLQTTLVKKPKKDKIKLKGPTKKYLKAGLFSDTFKVDPPADMPSTTNTSASNTPVHQSETLIEEQVQSDNEESLLMQDLNHCSPDDNHTEGKLRFEDKDAQYNGKEPLYTDNDEFSTLLPPPCYVYNKERRKLNDFQLPYDIWWQHVNNQLSHPVNPAKNYKKIKGNVFYDVKPTSNFEEQSCICVKPKNPNQLGCGEDCLNRAMWVECNPNLCPCGDQCSNQRLLKNEWSSGLERFLTRNRGWGVRTTQIIKKSSFIIEYIGEIVSEKVFKDRMAETYSADSHHYCLNITSDILIDGYRLANEGRFVNHSCEPNSVAEKWSVNGYYRVGLFALRDIEPGEEITYDYNFYSYNSERQQACYCGSSKCRGVIGGKTKRDTAQSKQDASSNLNSMEKLIIVKSILKKSENKRKEGYLSKVENCGTFDNTLLSLDKKKLFELIKQFSYTTSKYIRKHNLFLIRNFEKFRQLHNKRVEKKRKQKSAAAKDEIYYSNSKSQTKNVFNPLYLTTNPQSRLARTRGYAKVQDNEELIKFYKLCNLFKEICQCFVDKIKDQLKDDKQLEAIFNHLNELPKRKKNENQEIDLISIERNILSGSYKTEDAFKDEIGKLFTNARKHFKDDKDKSTDKIDELEKQFNTILDEKLAEFSAVLNLVDENVIEQKEKLDDSFESKLSKNQITLPSSLRLSLAAITQTTKETLKMLDDSQKLNQINLDHLDKLPPSPSSEQETNQQEEANCELQQLYHPDELPKFKQITLDENDEIIRCICTLNREEGTMIQCDQCNCWAHAHCMKADLEAESYLCEKCNPRELDLEIKLEKQPVDAVEGWTYYFSLTIGNNIIKIGDTVYLERDKVKNLTSEQLSKKNLVTFTDFDGKKMSKADVDIFKIEHLYTTADGKKFVYGYHCLRPSETYHEPTRKFFNNEVLCSPLGGCAQLEAVKGICHVLDLSSYCKGRPIGAREEDVYICEFKVCKKARSFSKISKNYLGVNTKPYCFNHFEERIYPKRTFSPHNTIVKKESKSTAKQQQEKQQKEDKPVERNQAPKVEQIELSEADIANINKLHLRTYVQKQFNINKIVAKITKLNEINDIDNQDDDKMEVDN